MASELHDVIAVNDLDATLNYHELNREELDVPCSVDHCRELAKKVVRWEPLLQHIGLDECDRIAIEKNYSSYEEQRIALLSKWKRRFGSRATYLKLAEGLEKIDHLDLVEELCKIYKSKPAEPYQQDISDDEKEISIEITAKEPTHLKQRRDWKEILDDHTILKIGIVSSVIVVIIPILVMLNLVLPSSTLVIMFLLGISIPMVQTYYIGGALLKEANGDVWKNVVIGGGLLGGLIGGVYWIFMGKNIPGTHLGAVIGIFVSVVMFGTILAGVLLGMAINRYAFLIIIVMLTVGAACFYAVSPDCKSFKDFNAWYILPFALISILLLILQLKYLSTILIIYTFFTSSALLCTYAISSDCGIWLPIAGAYYGTVYGVVWAYLDANYLFV